MSAADRLNEIEARANAADRAGVFESDFPTWDAWEAAWDSSTDVPALVAALQAVLRVCDATEATPVPGIVITGAHVSTTNIRRAIEEALS